MKFASSLALVALSLHETGAHVFGRGGSRGWYQTGPRWGPNYNPSNDGAKAGVELEQVVSTFCDDDDIFCIQGPPIPNEEPICEGLFGGTPLAQSAVVPTLEVYNELVADLDIPTVVGDLVELLTQSDPCWPADSFETSTIGQSYAGLFVRMAWHCSGAFRATDGAGGCAGGRQRFPPESEWPDNTNLDKARALVYPIKVKYGDALSWGDLMVLAGGAAILHGGGPVTELCVGRVDEADGTNSLPLGPSDIAPECPRQGDCPAPLGTSVVGLIYVNPEGYLGNPNTAHSALQIREIFGRMDFNDSETVALIGGGHAFGKSHGACPDGPGPGPDDQPLYPWPGACGTGRGEDTATSGIEGAWTTDPFKFDNQFFKLLQSYGDTYRLQRGPGDAYQWYTPHEPDLMMLTTDLALIADEAYAEIVEEFATNEASLDTAFANAWEKLTIRGGSFAASKHCWIPDDRFTANELRQ